MPTIDYKKLRKKVKTQEVKKMPLLAGTWLPVSAISVLTKYSRQYIRVLYLQNKVQGITIPNTPLLICLEDVLSALRSK